MAPRPLGQGVAKLPASVGDRGSGLAWCFGEGPGDSWIVDPGLSRSLVRDLEQVSRLLWRVGIWEPEVLLGAQFLPLSNGKKVDLLTPEPKPMNLCSVVLSLHIY